MIHKVTGLQPWELRGDDIYYPGLQLLEKTNYNIGKFGHMRCKYLKEFKYSRNIRTK